QKSCRTCSLNCLLTSHPTLSLFFFFNHPPTPDIYTLSLHDALPISPPKSIQELVDVPLAPAVIIDSKGEDVVLLYRDQFKSIAELSEKELRLAGLRINPKTNIGSRTTYYNDIKVKKTSEKNPKDVQVLPSNARFSNFRISPDENKMAFLNTVADRVDLWVLDVKTGTANKLTTAPLNANLGFVINWFADSRS